jgi:hypothetical protein
MHAIRLSVASVLLPVLLLLLSSSSAVAKDAPAIAAGKKIAALQTKSFADPTGELEGPAQADKVFWILYGAPDDAWSSTSRGWQEASLDKRKLENLVIVPAADGKSAWMSFVITFRVAYPGDKPFPLRMRVTQLIAESPSGWAIIAGQASLGLEDKKVHEAAREGQMPGIALADQDQVPVALEPVVNALRDGSFAELIAERDDFVTVGSAPKEVSKKKGLFAKAWRGWGKAVSVDGPVIAGLAPGETTGWVAASLKVHKQPKGAAEYDVALQLFVVVAKDGDGWRVVQAHLAIPSGSE